MQKDAFKEPGGNLLKKWIDDCPNQLYSALIYEGGAAFKKRVLDDIGDQDIVSKLINKLGGIAETEDLADKYIKKCKASALKIDKHIQQEMLKLLDSSINRSK